jgi:hypothetical protein
MDCPAPFLQIFLMLPKRVVLCCSKVAEAWEEMEDFVSMEGVGIQEFLVNQVGCAVSFKVSLQQGFEFDEA